ncbi:hypothetical protein ACA910_017955 [Epithemia clementina (nom. ined.)]
MKCVNHFTKPTGIVVAKKTSDDFKEVTAAVVGGRLVDNKKKLNAWMRVAWCLVLLLLLAKLGEGIWGGGRGWNRMAIGVQALSSSSWTSPPQKQQKQQLRRKKLGFLSFDLDDTLFPTTRVVEDANRAMMARIEHHLRATFPGQPPPQGPSSLDVSEFLATTRHVRQQLTAPITYSDLRRRALAQYIQDQQPFLDLPSLDCMVEDCFQVWLQERHAAAERHLLDEVLPMLQQITRQENNHNDVCVAAITNGRGNPLNMPQTLAPYFDFCVSGEDEAVFPNRKPHSGIYQYAYQQYQLARPQHHHTLSASSSSTEVVEYVWCHVGDCLANDVGPSAANGALAIWFNPSSSSSSAAAADNYDNRKSSSSRSSTATTTARPYQPWSTATATEVSRRARLAQEAESQVAAQITSLSELPWVIEQLLSQSS